MASTFAQICATYVTVLLTNFLDSLFIDIDCIIARTYLLVYLQIGEPAKYAVEFFSSVATRSTLSPPTLRSPSKDEVRRKDHTDLVLSQLDRVQRQSKRSWSRLFGSLRSESCRHRLLSFLPVGPDSSQYNSYVLVYEGKASERAA